MYEKAKTNNPQTHSNPHLQTSSTKRKYSAENQQDDDEEEDSESDSELKDDEFNAGEKQGKNEQYYSVKLSPFWAKVVKYLMPLGTLMFYPLLQGVMLGLGQHGTRYLLSYYIDKKR